MADEPSGSGVGKSVNKVCKSRNLRLNEILEAVLDSEEEISDCECFGDSSLDESSDEEESIPLQFV